MTPETFLAEVAQPNTQMALEDPDDLRATVNAILTLDALVGMFHAHGKAAGRPEIVEHASDDGYREALAHVSPSYRVLRDAAASLKHGELTHPRRKALARLVRGPEALGSEPNTLGMFECGDEIGGDVVVIRYDPGPGYVRASNVIADTFRMLKRVVEGEPARTDEHDRGSFPTDDED
jgi:hypothetical protein